MYNLPFELRKTFLSECGTTNEAGTEKIEVSHPHYHEFDLELLNEEITAIIHGEIYTRSGLECKGLITTKKIPFDQGPVNGEGKGEINSKFIQHPGTGGFRPILSGGGGPNYPRSITSLSPR